MAEVAELPVIGWIAQRFRGKPQSTVETPPLISPPPEPAIAVPKAPVTVQEPKLSREERRAKKKAEYAQRKAAEQQTSITASPPAAIAPAEVVTPPVTEEKPANLPSGIKERVRFPQSLSISREEIRWLEEDKVQVPLELMTLATTEEEQFLYGSLIHGKKLKRLLGQMTGSELESADDLLFVQLSELMQKRSAPDIEMVHNHITARPIFETGNRKGQRVYFMRFDNLQGIPVIIRIAAANNHKITEVFSVISTENRRQIRRGGGG